jgi:conjugal transfer pilus assembly protein TraK
MPSSRTLPARAAHLLRSAHPPRHGVDRMPVPRSWERRTTRFAGQAVTAAAFLGGLPALALQFVEASDGVAAEAIVSTKEPTRIRIEGAAITDVFGNIHSSQCGAAGPGSTAASAPSSTGPGAPGTSLSNAAGDVTVACDREKGEIYLRPVGDGPRPINLFVSSAAATYTLLLRRADTPADTIVIRDRTPRAPLRTAGETVAAGPAPNHVRTMKALLVAMASDRVPPDIRVEETHRPLQLWAQARFTLARRYAGRGFVGEKYALQNMGSAPMVLAEQEFDRPEGRETGEIAGIAIEHHNLAPGEATSVYVLRRGGSE